MLSRNKVGLTEVGAGIKVLWVEVGLVWFILFYFYLKGLRRMPRHKQRTFIF